MKAAKAGNYQTAQFLLSRGAQINKPTMANDHTPLSLACANGHYEVAELLLLNGADPNYKLKVRFFYIRGFYWALDICEAQHNSG